MDSLPKKIQMKSIKYEVIFEPFTNRHFVRSFSKKTEGAWDFTLKFLRQEFEQIDILFLKSIAEIIADSKEMTICKTEFKIAGTQVSRHGSGNRCIVAINKNINMVSVLLVYHKNNLGGDNETSAWKNLVRENYPEYSNIL
jgi:hypothetical protein